MAMVINTNIGALNAVRLLDRSASEQSTSMERLTSGLRINKSADDAAGQAVATKMTTQIRGTDQAIRNVNDGIGFVQTQDGAMEEVVTMMQRMRELGVQSLNGTYTAENRNQMDAEFQELAAEIQRIGQTTTFNGVNIMNGSLNAMSIHAGWDIGANNKIQISTFDVSALGVSLDARDVTTVANASAAISVIDAKLSDVNTIRAKWGALQNRLESTVSNLSNVNENMNAARSRIQDADFAKESANLARTQVLQQAGMSMLSQANQQSQNVMQLLQ
ncbi:flagellin [Thiomicrorhabdus sp. zzn3]|uniref:flagellin N-terminal helical domain-containing protein n=1 Tax=Thiomicrorhabdus sp. zzn3 TaxID=3039775 RepID=UPI00243664D4|nr:flagellin [Thiomicrorhabdus sp. zzn3]MDG6777621.1 flagellin [Thiomicrorhabdus sp. zzn3]